MDLLFQQPGLDGLPPSLAECLDTLAQAAAALQLSDTRPAVLAAAARQAAAGALEAQDREEVAFDVGRQLVEQVATTQCALAELQCLAQQLGAAAGEQQDAAASRAAAVAPNLAKAAQYVERQRQLEAVLSTRGVCAEIMQARLQAAGREQGAAAAELARVERELERYCGLPADASAAAAATQAKREELVRLRQRLQEHLETIE